MIDEVSHRIGDFALKLCPLKLAQFVVGKRLQNANMIGLGRALAGLTDGTIVGFGAYLDR